MTTNLGNAPGNVTLADRVNPEYWRYSFGIERQFPGDFLVEVSYLGQRGRHLPILETRELRAAAVPHAEPDSRCRGGDVPEPGVSNPFVGLTPDSPGSNGATIARRRLLYQYPQFEASGICTGSGTFCTETDNGSNVYHGMIFRADKRFTHGFMLMSSYTWSHMRERVTPLNPWEEPEERVAAVDRPHRITFASVLELPVGRDRRWGATGRRSSTRFSADGSSARSSSGRSASRSSSTTTPTSIRRAAIRRS